MGSLNDKPLIEVFGSRPGRHKLTLNGAVKANITKGSKVLEIGCAHGDSCVLLSQKFGCSVIGVDISEEIIEKAIEKHITAQKNGKVQFVVANAAELPFPDKTFDIILSEAAFSLIEDKERAAKEYYRVLVPEGKVIVNDFTIHNKIAEELHKKMKFIPCFAGVKTVDGYIKVFEKIGFKKICFEDHSKEIIKTALWISKSYTWPADSLGELFARLLGCSCNKNKNIENSKEFFKKARLGYVQLIFEKA